METLRLLNPQYKLDIVPATTKTHTLVLRSATSRNTSPTRLRSRPKTSMYLKEYINPANIDKKRQERSGTVYVVKRATRWAPLHGVTT